VILQALKEYYDRKVADRESGIPPHGWFQGKIDFVIVLNRKGEFDSLHCEQKTKDGKTVSDPRLLPYIGKQALKHSNSGQDANLLWDNATFVLGLGKKGKTKLSSFITTTRQKLGDTNDPAVRAVLRFLESGQRSPSAFAPVLKHKEYGEEIAKGRAILTFRIKGDTNLFAFERPTIKARVSTGLEELGKKGTCLVTGEENQPIELCHLVIKNLYGAAKDPNVVSFNEAAFRSFGKQQGANAPVGNAAADAYTKALNYLTRFESKQKLQLGDATTVFWSERDSPCSQKIESFFGTLPDDNPDKYVEAVESLFNSVKTGAFNENDSKDRFFVLGMTPFGPRIAIRFWIVDTVKGMSGKICAHFKDTEIVAPKREKEDWPRWLPLNALLAATANEAKYDNKKPNLVRFRKKYYDVKPNLEGDTMRALLGGLPYPQTLLQGATRRIRAEQEITYPRAALIKACLNRSIRFNNPEKQEELKVSLDPNNTNIGYRLGRLFAALERIQIEANRPRKLNATIRSRYYGAASSTPVAVFGTLMNRLNPHHLDKLPGWLKALRSKTLCEIVDAVDGRIAFPPHLTLEDQGRFAIGYYHQTQQFDTEQKKGN
jgi:CRISPR-associated protein Csd1